MPGLRIHVGVDPRRRDARDRVLFKVDHTATEGSSSIADPESNDGRDLFGSRHLAAGDVVFRKFCRPVHRKAIVDLVLVLVFGQHPTQIKMHDADSTSQTSGGDPYRRKVPTFSSALDRTLEAQVVTLGRIKPDQSAFRVRFEPNNPAADASGNVKYPT